MDAQESQIYHAIILAVIVVGSVVFYFFYSIFKHHKKVLTLERDSAGAQVNALEKDRSRIAADLHDDLAPMLVAVKMRVNSFDLENKGDQQQLEKVNQIIDDMARRMRAISFDLMPVTLQEKGLLTAIREFVSSINNRDGDQLKIRLSLTEATLPLGSQKIIHAYRIIQEIVHNTIKHAGATELTIAIKRYKDQLIIETKDNGKGFDYHQKLAESKGLGLKSLINRVHLLRGRLNMDSKPGEGTFIIIQIPTDNEYTIFEN